VNAIKGLKKEYVVQHGTIARPLDEEMTLDGSAYAPYEMPDGNAYLVSKRRPAIIPYSSVEKIKEAHRSNLFWASALVGATLLCTTGWYASLGYLMQFIANDRGTAGPGMALYFWFTLLLTFIPASFCAGIAVVLGGWKRSKLAWISYVAYLVPIILMSIISAWRSIIPVNN
jgi:hypothetical protein